MPGWRPDYSHVSGNLRSQAFSLSHDRLEKHDHAHLYWPRLGGLWLFVDGCAHDAQDVDATSFR